MVSCTLAENKNILIECKVQDIFVPRIKHYEKPYVFHFVLCNHAALSIA